MPIRLDPADLEREALFDFAGSFDGLTVLEVGCGNGRLTWRFARQAAYVDAIDPDAAKIARAQANIPPDLRNKVRFWTTAVEMFTPGRHYDLALLSWSL